VDLGELRHSAAGGIVVCVAGAGDRILGRDCGGGMPSMQVQIKTDENGYFSKTVRYNPPGPFPIVVRLSATLLDPFGTGLWGALDIDAEDGSPSNQKRSFVAWHSEEVLLGSWRLDGGENIIVVNGKTKPKRANARLVLQIDATV
jgi:hypothetical protein